MTFTAASDDQDAAVIPPALQHDTVIEKQSTTFLTEFSALFERK